MWDFIKVTKLLICCLTAVFLIGCNSVVSNSIPDKTNQIKNQINGPNNIILMGGTDIDVRGNWFGISSSQKNCFFSFNEDGSYEYAAFSDPSYSVVSEYEKGSYFIIGDNEIMFVSNTVTSLPDNLFFNIDSYRRKITFFENPQSSYTASYEVYNSEYYTFAR